MKNWYAIYVKSRSEKKAALELTQRGIQNYLPLKKVLKQWSDRKKWVEEPLFRSYLFVHIDQQEYFDVLQAAGVVKYITFEGQAVSIPPKQIDAIRYFLEEKDFEETTFKDWKKGQSVEVVAGSLTGLTGKLIEFKGKHKLLVEIEAIGHSIHIQISKNQLRPIT